MKKIIFLITIALTFTYCSSTSKVKKHYIVTSDGSIKEVAANSKAFASTERKIQAKKTKYETLKVGTKKNILDDKGKKIGELHQISKSEQQVKFDKNQDGIFEKIVVLKNNKIEKISFDNNEDKKIDSILMYKDNTIEKVLLYNQKTSQLKSISSLSNGKVDYVDLINKNKRVYFDKKGAVSQIVDLDKIKK